MTIARDQTICRQCKTPIYQARTTEESPVWWHSLSHDEILQAAKVNGVNGIHTAEP